MSTSFIPELFPPTTERVPRHTDDDINERITRRTDSNVAGCAADRDLIDLRLRELDREWDIERALEANAATMLLIGLALGRLVNRRVGGAEIAAHDFQRVSFFVDLTICPHAESTEETNWRTPPLNGMLEQECTTCRPRAFRTSCKPFGAEPPAHFRSGRLSHELPSSNGRSPRASLVSHGNVLR